MKNCQSYLVLAREIGFQYNMAGLRAFRTASAVRLRVTLATRRCVPLFLGLPTQIFVVRILFGVINYE